jgi:hypothetical protein
MHNHAVRNSASSNPTRSQQLKGSKRASMKVTPKWRYPRLDKARPAPPMVNTQPKGDSCAQLQEKRPNSSSLLQLFLQIRFSLLLCTFFHTINETAPLLNNGYSPKRFSLTKNELYLFFQMAVPASTNFLLQTPVKILHKEVR